MKDVASNPAKVAAVLKLPMQPASGLLDVTVFKAFLTGLFAAKVRRWMLLPPHFKYGNNGDAAMATACMAAEMQ